MIKLNILFIFILFTAPIVGQPKAYKKILNDPKVIWAAECTLELDIPSKKNTLDLEKNAKQNTQLKSTEKELSTILMEHCLDTRFPAYIGDILVADSYRFELLDIIEKRIVKSVPDSATQLFNTNQILENALQSIRIKGLFFCTKSGKFDFYAAAYTPVFYVEGYKQTRQFYPWFKLPNYSSRKQKKRPKIENARIVWAQRIDSGNKFIYLDSLRIYKNFEPPVMQTLIDKLRADKDFEIQNFKGESIAFAEREAMFVRYDTAVIACGDNGYDEQIKILKQELKGDEMMQIKTQIDLFWDAKKEVLIVRLFAFAPMYPQRDEQGNFRFWRPVFWREVEW